MFLPDVNEPDFLSGKGEKPTKKTSHSSRTNDYCLHAILSVFSDIKLTEGGYKIKKESAH
jgi:hypothetical protein